MAVMNGQARGAGLPAASPQPPSTIPVHHAGPASSWPQQENKSTPSRTVDGDAVIRVLAAVVVLAVAAFAAVVSYSHIFDLGTHHGQNGTAARLLPLSVDGLIAAASLVMLQAARKRLPVPLLARIGLMLGVGATVAANVGYGLPFGWLSAVISAWPAVAFIVSVELAVRFVDDARRVAVKETAHDGKSAEHRVGSKSGTGEHETQPEPRRDNGSGDRKLPQKRPSASDKARDLLSRNPGLDKAVVAKRAGVSVRTVERVMGGATETGGRLFTAHARGGVAAWASAGGDRWRGASGALRTAAGDLAGCRLRAVSLTRVHCGGSAGPVTGVVFVLVVSAGLHALERGW